MARGYRGFRREPSSGKKMCDVLYWVDVNEGYHENVKVGDSVLNPTSFTPTKSGYTFLGWKDSGIASADIFTDKTAEDASMILFAVFTKTIMLTQYNASNTASYQYGTQYYNNSDILNPLFTLTEIALSGWTKRGWTTNASEYNATVADGGTVTLSENATYYSLYQQTITVTYYNYGGTASSKTGTRIANVHATTTTSDPSFTLTQTAISGWTPRGWTTSSSGGASAISYSNGVVFTRSSNITLYGCYYRTVTVSYNGNGATSGSTAASTGTAYYHTTSGGTNASISIRGSGFAKTDYTFVRWRLNGTSGAAYSAGSTYSSTGDATMYAEWTAYTRYYYVFYKPAESATGAIEHTVSKYRYYSNGATALVQTKSCNYADPFNDGYFSTGWGRVVSGRLDVQKHVAGTVTPSGSFNRGSDYGGAYDTIVPYKECTVTFLTSGYYA